MMLMDSHKAPCTSLGELITALKQDIDAGAQSSNPECMAVDLCLDVSAILPLQRPVVGPYADGGTHDLPAQWKINWTKPTDGTKPHPQAHVNTITSCSDSRDRSIVQRAAARGIVTAVEVMDGFKYSFNNAWTAKDDDGQRFSYICQDSMQNKDRHANGFTRTQKHLKGDGGGRGPRKPTFDCKGSISIKISSNRPNIDVYYRHYAIHGTVTDRRGNPLRNVSGHGMQDEASGGLFAKLAAEKSAYEEPPPKAKINHSGPRQEASNIGRPLKRKRETGTFIQHKPDEQELSLADVLKRSQASRTPASPSAVTPKPTTSKLPPPVSYDLPSWMPKPKEKPAPPPPPTASTNNQRMPLPPNPNRQKQPQQSTPTPTQSGLSFTSPYPPPYQSAQSTPYYQPQLYQQARSSTQFQPSSQTQPSQQVQSSTNPLRATKVQPASQTVNSGSHEPQSQGQGLFMAMKPTRDTPTLSSSNYSTNLLQRTSCIHCRAGKLKCDQQIPSCGACQRAGRHDCAYDLHNQYEGMVPAGQNWYQWPTAGAAPAANMMPPANMAHGLPQNQMQRRESPDPWFPKR